MIGLKAEPGWRLDWMARLNWVCLKSLPPIMALTSPVSASMHIRADWATGICSRSTIHESAPFLSACLILTNITSPTDMASEGFLILAS